MCDMWWCSVMCDDGCTPSERTPWQIWELVFENHHSTNAIALPLHYQESIQETLNVPYAPQYPIHTATHSQHYKLSVIRQNGRMLYYDKVMFVIFWRQLLGLLDSTSTSQCPAGPPSWSAGSCFPCDRSTSSALVCMREHLSHHDITSPPILWLPWWWQFNGSLLIIMTWHNALHSSTCYGNSVAALGNADPNLSSGGFCCTSWFF